MGNQVALTKKILNEAPSVSAMFEIEAVKNASVMNRVKTTGESEEAAAIKYERERVLLMKQIQANMKAFEEVSKESIYFAWVELHASGSTLADGCSFIIPYGKVAQFQMGWKGNLDRINMMPGVTYISQPQVVHKSDEFEYELGKDAKVIKHKPGAERGKDIDDIITHVYTYVGDSGRDKCFILERHQVIAIRDRYSKLFKGWRSKGGRTHFEDGGFVHAKWPDGNIIDLPFWLISYDGNKTATDAPDAFKKTLVNKIYSEMPNKTGRMKSLDKLLENRPEVEDPREETDQPINYGLSESGEKVDTGTGEVIETTHTVVNEENKPEPKAAKIDLGKITDAF